MMRVSLLVLSCAVVLGGLTACELVTSFDRSRVPAESADGSDDGGNPDASSTEGGVILDAAALVTVIVTDRGTREGVAGQACYFVDPSGQTTMVRTDKDGRAAAPLPGGGSLTALLPTSGLVTIASVQGGDIIRLLRGMLRGSSDDAGPPGDYVARVQGTIEVPDNPPTSIPRLDLAQGCVLKEGISSAGPSTTSYSATVAAGCPADGGVEAIFSVEELLPMGNDGGTMIEYRNALKTFPLAVDGGAPSTVDVSSADLIAGDVGLASFTVSNFFPRTHIYFVADDAAYSLPQYRDFKDQSVFHYLLPPTGFASAMVESYGGSSRTPFQTHVRRGLVATTAIDSYATFLPQIMGASVTEGLSRVVSWSLAAPLAVDASAVLHLTYAPTNPDNTGITTITESWIVFPVPAGVTELHAPSVPSELAVAAGLAGAAEGGSAATHVTLMLIASPQLGYATVRAAPEAWMSVVEGTDDDRALLPLVSAHHGDLDLRLTSGPDRP